MLWVALFVAEFLVDMQEDHHANGYANSQAKNVPDVIDLVFANVSQGQFQGMQQREGCL
jgi:hypothetical protein